jgi:hypothetical protein
MQKMGRIGGLEMNLVLLARGDDFGLFMMDVSGEFCGELDNEAFLVVCRDWAVLGALVERGFSYGAHGH